MYTYVNVLYSVNKELNWIELGEVQIPRKTAAHAYFVGKNKGAWWFYLSSDTR